MEIQTSSCFVPFAVALGYLVIVIMTLWKMHHLAAQVNGIEPLIHTLFGTSNLSTLSGQVKFKMVLKAFQSPQSLKILNTVPPPPNTEIEPNTKASHQSVDVATMPSILPKLTRHQLSITQGIRPTAPPLTTTSEDFNEHHSSYTGSDAIIITQDMFQKATDELTKCGKINIHSYRACLSHKMHDSQK